MKKAGSKMSVGNKNKKSTAQPTVKSYGNEPFFVKKADDSKKALEKRGMPKDLTRRS